METVTLFADYKEEGWESMRLYTQELVYALKALYEKRLHATAYVAMPALSRRFSSKIMRWMFRYAVSMPAAPFHQGDLNHIVDQANAHLLTVLDPKKTIITVHDLIVPMWMNRWEKRKGVKKRIAYAVRFWRIRNLARAEAIIAVSQATKTALIENLGIAEEKIYVVPEGVETSFRRVTNKLTLSRLTTHYHLPKNFLLHVGTTQPYKNLEGALTLFEALSRKNKKLHFVKVGAPWTASQRALITKLQVRSRVHHIGFVPRPILPALYTLATALVQLSHIEGFGFPVLEAMRCGCPVIASLIPAHKELLGDHGLYVSPRPTKKDVLAAQQFITHKTQRMRVVDAAQKQSLIYTWKRTAQKTFRVYASVLEKVI